MPKFNKFVLVEFIDTHTHNYDEAYAGCEDEVIRRALDAGVSKLIQADIDSVERGRMFSLVEKYPGTLHPMLGLYPGSVGKNWKDEIDAMLPFRSRGIVAVGEIGLDYHDGTEFKEEQKEAFRVQLELAHEWNLPVNIHLRDASEDFISIMKDCRALHLRGNLHAYGGSPEFFNQVCRYGEWYAGIGGVLTFKKAFIAESVKEIPIERILLETDSPYLAPTPHRGERNESAYIPIIAGFLADRKGMSIEAVAEATTGNAKRLFSI